ncbi:MAG: hypothetical protein JXB07_01040 [Anaerolineae bacterium]|nr:hypothetical protein [Anaerolineae bacterium]
MDEDHPASKVLSNSEWERARLAATWEAVQNVFSDRSTDLLAFEDVRKHLRLAQKNYRGLQDIPVSQIRGSVGRYRDFTRTFLPRSNELRMRWTRINTLAYAKGMDPIDVYQVGDAYFVLDGNHRVSVARQMGNPTIQAHVWEFSSLVGLSADADLDEVLIRAEYADFLERTGLAQLRPEQQIVFTTPGRYREIEDQIEWYRHVLEMIDDEPASYEDAVTAWYDMIYTPAVQIIQQRGALTRFPRRTEADLFVWVWRYKEELRRYYKTTSLTQVIDTLTRPGWYRFLGRLWRAVKGWLTRQKTRDRRPLL